MIGEKIRARIFANLRAIPEARRKSGAPCGAALPRALRRAYDAEAVWRGPHPFPEVSGPAALAEAFWIPLMRSFPDLERRDFLFYGGEWRGRDWLTACGHWVGTFARDFMGIPATGGAVFLRYGEFHEIADGRIRGTTTIVDWVDLARQAGAWPLPASLGAETTVPAPATRDGVRMIAGTAAESARSLALMEAMMGGLRSYRGDLAELKSMGQGRFWHPRMMWHGPAGIGTTRGLRGFEDFHQRPFVGAFPDRMGGDHYARFADGAYIASSGWPSLHATHSGGEWLGLAPTGKKITMRVMDWWRREGDFLRENWVMIDLPELFAQMGHDLLARAQRRGEAGGVDSRGREW